MKRRLIPSALVLLALCALSYAVGALAKAEERKGTAEEVYRHLHPFVDSLTQILDKYVDVEKADPQELIYGAIQGMVSTLDPFSQFLKPEDYKELQTETSGEFGGLGIEIAVKEGRLTVVTPIEGTPADRAGLQAGDRILKIDGETTDGITLMEAVKKLRGKKGTQVTLTVDREGLVEPFPVTITRDIIKIQSVRAYRFPADVGYVRVSEFIEGTADDFRRAVEDLEKEGPLKGLVVDLRNDPGGLLGEAVRTADFFVAKDNVIVTTKGRYKGQDYVFRASGGRKYTGPVAVLINEGSASGSEIVAGALRDHGLAVLVGTRTFGKASVQTIFPIENTEAALRLTTAKYYTPSEKSIHGVGVEPDLKLPSPKLSESTVKVMSRRYVEEYARRIQDRFPDPGANTDLPDAVLREFFAYCAKRDPKILESELREDAESLETGLVLELVRRAKGEKEARRAAVLRDQQVHAARDVVENGGRIPKKWKEVAAALEKREAAAR